jgi:predicted transcriptional regulator
MKNSHQRPSDLELQVLGVLWERGQATAREVREALPDGKQRAYTTVLSVLQVMEKKGLLRRQVDAVTHVWRPAVTRRQITSPLLKGLMHNVFGGRPSAVLQQLLSNQRIDEDELEELRRVLEAHEGRSAGGRSAEDAGEATS